MSTRKISIVNKLTPIVLLLLISFCGNLFGADFDRARVQIDVGYHDTYSQERIKFQNRILSEFYPAIQTAFSPRIIFTAGGPGSGKSTVINSLSNLGYFGSDTFLLIDPDKIRARIVTAENLSITPGSKEDQTLQKEVGYLSEILLWNAIEEGKNVVFDTTMRSTKFFKELIEKIRKGSPGYQLEIVHVIADNETVENNIKQRSQREQREVPVDIIDVAPNQSAQTIVSIAHEVDRVLNIVNSKQDAHLLTVQTNMKPVLVDIPINSSASIEEFSRVVPPIINRPKTDVLQELDFAGKYVLKVKIEPNPDRFQFDLVDTNFQKGVGNQVVNQIFKSDLNIIVNGQATKKIIHEDQKKNVTFIFENSSDTRLSRVEVRFFDHTIGSFNINSDTRKIKPLTAPIRLAPVDLRMFAQRGKDYSKDWLKSELELVDRSKFGYVPIVDLHTHFGGAIRAETILQVALEYSTPYPTVFLDELGIIYPKSEIFEFVGKPHIVISEKTIGQNGLEKLKAALAIDVTAVATFRKMDQIYRLRGPLVKDQKSFGRYLEELALDYKKMGIQYAELSLADVMNPDWLKIVHEKLPQIEVKTGVKIRFLAALWRHNDPIYNHDMLMRLKALKSSPYIVGVDFMGHETNATAEFAPLIQEIAQVMKQDNPDFVIRIHAGENPKRPSNVRDAIKAGATRIGHGLYGMDAETIRLAKEKNVIIEFNVNSNIALNNVLDPAIVPIKKYLGMGVPVSLGTDGHGLYQTSNVSEQIAARRAGLTVTDLESIRRSDKEYIDRMENRFTLKLRMAGSLTLPSTMPQPEFNENTWQLAEAKRQEGLALLRKELNINEIEMLTPEEFVKRFEKKKKIIISGGSKRQWLEGTPSDVRNKILNDLATVIPLLNPKEVTFVTGGTRYGAESEAIHSLAMKYGFEVVALGSEEIKLSEIDKGVTHLVISGRTWFDKAPLMVSLTEKGGGLILFIGGGPIVSDEIQAAHNARASFVLMNHVGGASEGAAKNFPEKAFEGYELEKVFRQNGFNLMSAVPVYSVISADQAIRELRNKGKKIVSFVGYSAAGYKDNEQMLKDAKTQLFKLDPASTIINIGCTRDGIGQVYQIAKEMGFETTGILSQKNIKDGRLSPYVDQLFIIEDLQSGGFLPGTRELSPTSRAMVESSDELIAIGGNRSSAEEVQSALRSNKKVTFIAAEMNPDRAIEKARAKGTQIPTDLSGAVAAFFKSNGSPISTDPCLTIFKNFLPGP